MKRNNSRAKKTALNVIFNALYQLTIFACNLILPRMILVAYGSSYNGIVSSITQFMNFVAILRIGVAGATRVELYKSLAKNDTKKTSSIIKATENFMRKISVIIAIYLVVLAIVYPFVIDGDYSWISISALVILIGVGTLAQYMFGLTYQTLLQADQRLYIYNIIQIISTIVNTAISCILINAGFSIQVVKLFSAIIFTATPIFLCFFVRKHYHLDRNAAPDDKALKKKNDVMAHSIANIVHDNTDVVVLTIFSTTKIVSVYTVYNFVMNGLKQLLTIFTSSLEALFGDMWVKKEYKKIEVGLDFFELLVASFISIAFSCAFVLILPFAKVYTRGVNDINYILPVYAILALLAQIFYCYRIPYLTIVQAAGKYKETKGGAFGEAITNVVLSIILTLVLPLDYKIYGVVIGTLVANALRTMQYISFLSKNLVKRKYSRAYLKISWSVLNIVVSCGIYYLMRGNNVDYVDNWLIWVREAIIIFVISLIVWAINTFIFYRRTFSGVSDFMQKFRKKKKQNIFIDLGQGPVSMKEKIEDFLHKRIGLLYNRNTRKIL